MQEINAQIAAEKVAKSYEARIAELEKALEREQEWKPYEDTDNVPRKHRQKQKGGSTNERVRTLRSPLCADR